MQPVHERRRTIVKLRSEPIEPFPIREAFDRVADSLVKIEDGYLGWAIIDDPASL